MTTKNKTIKLESSPLGEIEGGRTPAMPATPPHRGGGREGVSFGIATNIRSKVQVCTPALMDETLDSAHVAGICAEIEDALEACRRGELTRDEYDTLKGELKKRLPIFTFHATFKNGRRKNDEAIPRPCTTWAAESPASRQTPWLSPPHFWACST